VVGSLSHSHGSWRFISAALVRKNRVSGKDAYSDPSTQETLAVGDFRLDEACHFASTQSCLPRHMYLNASDKPRKHTCFALRTSTLHILNWPHRPMAGCRLR